MPRKTKQPVVEIVGGPKGLFVVMERQAHCRTRPRPTMDFPGTGSDSDLAARR
jgi:hypothetical protein